MMISSKLNYQKQLLLLEDKTLTNVVKLNLGEKINPENIYHFLIPTSPNLPQTLGGVLCNLNEPNTWPHVINDTHYLIGIEDNPNHQIKTVTYHLTNYDGKVSIAGHLDNGVWRISPYLLPMPYLIEYSEDLKLEVTIELDTQKKRFYQFFALYTKGPEIESFYFCLPSYEENKVIEFIGKIWRITRGSAPPPLTPFC